MLGKSGPKALPLVQLCGLAAALGIFSHLLYFIRGEHHRESMQLLQMAIIIPSIATYALFSIGQFNFAYSAGAVAALMSSYLGALFSSMLVYRLFFHRLGKFPGPPMAKVSKLWHAKEASTFENFKRLDAFHKTYGEYVRVGPSEISIIDPEAPEVILGPKSKCIKAPWYDMSLPLMSMHNARDKPLHDKRRRVWDRGFNSKALRAYESRVVGYAHELIKQIQAFGGKPLNATSWFMYYSFDVMGELAFGKSFDMLTKGESHYAVSLLHEGTKPIGLFTPIPWAFLILSQIPFLSAGYQKWLKYCDDQIQNRKKNEPEEPDIMSWLLDSDPMPGGQKVNDMWLTGDSRLIIVAGSDTTSATMTHCFYHLCQDPSLVDKLREELDPIVAQQGEEFDLKSVQDAKHLNGVIFETLRMHPPVPSGVLRLTPPEGIEINGTYIPGNTTVSIPSYTIQRYEKAFERPNEFIPERWYSQPELNKYEKAFAPFSLGPYGCIGRNLALMELRTVITLLVTKFDVTFAPGEDGSKLLSKSLDYFTIGLEELKLQFKPRK